MCQAWNDRLEFPPAKLPEQSKLPPNVQVQVPAGQALPLIPGLPRHYNIEVTSQAWVRNIKPKGVTK